MYIEGWSNKYSISCKHKTWLVQNVLYLKILPFKAEVGRHCIILSTGNHHVMCGNQILKFKMGEFKKYHFHSS